MSDRIAELATVLAEKRAVIAKIDEEIVAIMGSDEITAAQQAVELSQKDLAAAQAKVANAVSDAEKRKRDGELEIAMLTGELHELTAPPKARKNKAASAKEGSGTGTRGYKSCPKCNTSVPSRSSVCSKCGHEFVKGAGAKKAAKKDGDGRGRRGQGEDLATYVVAVLSKYPTGLKLEDIEAKVLAAGYKTSSQNLKQAIYNVLGKLKKDGKVTKDDETKKLNVA